MLNIKRIVVTIFLLASGNALMAQNVPTVTVTFQSDASVTEPVDIIFGRQTLTLPAFVVNAGSSVTFSPVNASSASGSRPSYNLDAIARKSNIKSQPYSFMPLSSAITMTVSITATANKQITFSNPPTHGQGTLTVRTAGI